MAVALVGCGGSHDSRVILKGHTIDNNPSMNYEVRVYQTGHVRDEDYLVASAPISTDGRFELLVPEGTYDVDFLYEASPGDWYSITYNAGIVVTGPVKDMGDIPLYPPVP